MLETVMKGEDLPAEPPNKIDTPRPTPTLRAIKNRQSAQASRDRKRRHLVQVERHRAALLADNQQLLQRISDLESERARLVDTVAELKRDFVVMKDMIKQINGSRPADASASPTALSSPLNILGQTVGTMPASLPTASSAKTMIRSGSRRQTSVTRRLVYNKQKRPAMWWMSLLMSRFQAAQKHKNN